MEKGKKTNVILENTAANTTEKFDVNHAERILRMSNNGGWILPENSPFKFTVTNGIERRTTKGGTKNAKENGGN